MKLPSSFFKRQYGFAAFALVLLVFALVLTLALSISFLVIGQQRAAQHMLHSTRAYYAAESGIEDALIRFERGMSWTSSYSFPVDGAEANVSISGLVGGVRTITGQGDSQSRVRRVRVTRQLDSTHVALHYGAHIGEGGLHLAHNQAEIIGNVFSNGNVWGNSPATIVNSVIVAGAGNYLENITVQEHVQAYSCLGANVAGNVDYHAAGANTCSVGGGAATTTEIIAQEDFAVDIELLEEWMDEAEAGGIIDGGGDVHISGTRTLGPGKITGNLTLANNAILFLEGTIWATGDFLPGNNSIVELSSEYEDLSGAVIVDGQAQVANNVMLHGSGEPGSFIMLASTSDSLDESNPAILVRNNADNAIVYAPYGVIVVENNADLVEVLAYRLTIFNATIEYDVGLADARFTSGPGGGWRVANWREVE